MARILYGVSGEGFGHAARAKEIISYLLSAGHELTLVSYDKGLKYLSDHFPVEAISGFNLTYKDNQVQYLPTVFNNFLKSRDTIKSTEKIIDLVEAKQIDLVMSDYEPLSALVSNIKRLPLISIDNQHALTKTKLDYPRDYKSAYLVDKLVTKLMILKAEAYVVMSFFLCVPVSKKVFVFNPIIKEDVLKLRAEVGETVLVYLTSGFSGITEALKGQARQFIIYGLDKVGREDNLIFKKLDQATFAKDLASCHSIIATAGFAVITEALYLGKPYFALPAQAQFEQILNAYHLAKMGYGEHHDELSFEAVQQFLLKADHYRVRLGQGLEPGNDQIFTKVEELIAKYCPRK